METLEGGCRRVTWQRTIIVLVVTIKVCVQRDFKIEIHLTSFEILSKESLESFLEKMPSKW